MGDMISHIKYMDMYIGIIGSEDQREAFIDKMDEMYPGIIIKDIN